jgi:hypothetical protein
MGNILKDLGQAVRSMIDDIRCLIGQNSFTIFFGLDSLRWMKIYLTSPNQWCR